MTLEHQCVKEIFHDVGIRYLPNVQKEHQNHIDCLLYEGWNMKHFLLLLVLGLLILKMAKTKVSFRNFVPRHIYKDGFCYCISKYQWEIVS